MKMFSKVLTWQKLFLFLFLGEKFRWKKNPVSILWTFVAIVSFSSVPSVDQEMEQLFMVPTLFLLFQPSKYLFAMLHEKIEGTWNTPASQMRWKTQRWSLPFIISSSCPSRVPLCSTMFHIAWINRVPIFPQMVALSLRNKTLIHLRTLGNPESQSDF